MFSPKNLRTPLQAMVILTVILCFSSALALILENRKYVINKASHDNFDISRMTGFHIMHLLDASNRLFDKIERDIKTDGLKSFLSEDGRKRLLEQTQASTALQAILLISNKGKLLVRAYRPYPPEEIDYSDRDYFLRHQRGEDTVYGEQVTSRPSGRTTVTISRAIRSKTGELEAVILIVIENTHLSDLFKTAIEMENQEILVLRVDDGAVFFRFPEAPIGRRFPMDKIRALIAKKPSGFVEDGDMVDDKPRLFAYVKFTDFPLVILVSRDKEQVLESWKIFSALTLISIALMLGLLGIASRRTFFALAHTEELQRKLEWMAQTDSLTGLSNRAHFIALAEKEISRAKRYEGAFALLMIDVDHFKQVNDVYGHAMGDTVLQRFSQVFRQELRDIDIVGRLGGEEFAILLPQTGNDLALEVAERLRKSIAETTIELQTGETRFFTISIGVTTSNDPEVPLEIRLKESDSALYDAKHRGRNQVAVFQPTLRPVGGEAENMVVSASRDGLPKA